jgi:hypothetical protein
MKSGLVLLPYLYYGIYQRIRSIGFIFKAVIVANLGNNAEAEARNGGI